MTQRYLDILCGTQDGAPVAHVCQLPYTSGLRGIVCYEDSFIA